MRSSRHLAAIGSLVVLTLAACADPVAPRAHPEAPTGSLEPDGNATTPYAPTDLGVLMGGSNSYGEAINAAGDIAGAGDVAGGLLHAVLWVGTTATDLGVPFGTQSVAFGVNASQTVVGYSSNGSTQMGVVWKSPSSFTLLSSPGTTQVVTASGVNKNDVVCGYFLNNGTNFHAFRWTSGGGLVDVNPPGVTHSVALAISDNGVIAGYVQLANGDTHVAMWSAANVFTDLGTLGGTVGRGEAINSGGLIVGESSGTSGVVVPIVWRSSVGMSGLAAPGTATGVSDMSRLVGYVNTPTNSVAVTKKGSATTQILPTLTGGSDAFATGVNKCGNASGISTVSGGAYRAVRWTKPACD